MKKILHIEDKVEWQDNIRHALGLALDIERLEPVPDMDSFRNRGYPYADLYICDRHIPERTGERPNDESWRTIIDVISELHPTSKILFLSKRPPQNWRDYSQVVGAIAKSDFDLGRFRATIESVFGLPIGVSQEVIPYGIR